MRNFLIDTDTASDDAVAIIMALAYPDVRVSDYHRRRQRRPQAGNAKRALTAEVCNSDVPVFAGADEPLTRAHDHAHWFHGKDGMGDRGFPKPKRRPESELPSTLSSGSRTGRPASPW